MRILYHHRTLGDGAEGIHIQSIVNELSRLGNEVRVVSLVGEKTSFRESQESASFFWDRIKRMIPGPVYELAELAYNLKGMRILKKVISEFKPEIIYDRYAHYSFAALWAAKKYRLPLILEVNSPYSIQKRLWEKLYFKRLSEYVEKRIFQSAPHIIAVSSPLKKIIMDYGVDEDKITVLPNGTDPERFNPHINDEALRAKFGWNGKIVIGFVGILRRWHNIDILIEALKDLNLAALNAVMVFIGDGPSFFELKKYQKKLEYKDWLFFLGRIPHEQIQEYVAMMDIAISPHATPYSSPMKIIEYMAMEKAILAPDMDNIKDILSDGHNSILFKPDSKSSLQKKLKLLIEDAELRRKIGKNARYDMERSFTWKNNAIRTLELAKKLIRDYQEQR